MLKLSDESLNWALNHSLLKGDSDIFPRAFEFKAIEHDWDRIGDYLRKADILQWVTRPLRRCLSPERRYGFRVATQLDPLDFLVYNALVYEIGKDIEKQRIPVSPGSYPSVFSCRFAPEVSGEIFDQSVGYRSFQLGAIEIAQSTEFSHVVSTDISDFFPRLYQHRVEGALSSTASSQDHVKSLSRLFSQWNQRQSYGIPVGPSASRLVAEISIDDVDKILAAQGIPFIRYMDDYRLFAKSAAKGYAHLVVLANALFKNHGLTLQQEKTSILSSEHFLARYGATEEFKALDNLTESFGEFLQAVGIDDPYGVIEYDDLTPELQELIDSINLVDLLKENLSRTEVDQSMVRFLLQRLAQLDNTECAQFILNHIENAFTVFPQVIQYLVRLRSLSDEERRYIGQQALLLLDTSSLFQLDYHKTWLFSLFSDGIRWGNSESLVSLYSKSQDNFSRRKLALAIGRSNQHYWFRTHKDDVFEFGGWLRRAFLLGSSCLPSDEKSNWYRFLTPRLDILENAVVSWAKSNPLS